MAGNRLKGGAEFEERGDNAKVMGGTNNHAKANDGNSQEVGPEFRFKKAL